MNLLEELEGQAGEGMAVAVLRVLLLRSRTYRQELLRLLDSVSTVGQIATRAHFSCYAEHPTRDDELGDGRIDLVIEVDHVVIGIEAKFSAAFQPNQPTKYEKDLRDLATHLTDARRRQVRPFLVLMVPKARRADAESLIGPEVAVVTWEELADRLSRVEPEDGFSRVLGEEFTEFLQTRLDFLPGFASYWHHLVGQWEPRGTPEQQQFLRSLWRVLPNAGPRLGFGDTWVGYYFAGRPDGPRSWCGFIPRRGVDGPGKAVLIVAPPEQPSSLPAGCRQLIDPFNVDGEDRPTIEIVFDGTWSSEDHWSEVIRGLVNNRGDSHS